MHLLYNVWCVGVCVCVYLFYVHVYVHMCVCVNLFMNSTPFNSHLGPPAGEGGGLHSILAHGLAEDDQTTNHPLLPSSWRHCE